MKIRIPLLTLILLFAHNAIAQNDETQSLIDKGLNAEKLGLQDRALSYYNDAISAAPDNPQPYILIGKIQEKKQVLRGLIHFTPVISVKNVVADVVI